MAMAATTSSGEMTDMDCSPAELEEFIKEVRLLLTLNHRLNHISHLSFSPLSHLFLDTFIAAQLFFSHCHTVLSPPTLVAPSMHLLPLDLHYCEAYKGALLTTTYDVVVFLQEEGCSIQASPEYWSQGSVSGKKTFSTPAYNMTHTPLTKLSCLQFSHCCGYKSVQAPFVSPLK